MHGPTSPCVAPPARRCDPALALFRPVVASVKVAPHIAGRTRVDAAELERKLGRVPALVLAILWTRRDHRTGETTTTVAGVARAPGFERVPARSIKRAFARLRAAGLIDDRGWQIRDVPHGRSFAKRKVYVRVVYGGEIDGGMLAGGRRVLVPVETRDWILTSANDGGHGGRRHAAGRRSRGSNSSGPIPFSSGPSDGEFKRPPDHTYISKLETGVGLSRPSVETPRCGAPRSSSLGSETVGVDPQPGLGVDPRPSSDGGGHRPHDAPTPTRRDAEMVDRGHGLADLLAAITTRPRGTTTPETGLVSGRIEGGVICPRPPATTASPLAGVPPYPGAASIGLATTPHPPMLDTDATDLELAHALADAYRGAVRSRFACEAFTLRASAPIQRSKHYETIVAGARALRDHDFSPAAWAAWSCDVWKHYGEERGQKAKPPPVAWTFGAKRVHERRGWFTSEEASYIGGRVIIGRQQRELVERYTLMRMAIDRAQAWHAPAAVVAMYFPGDSYAKMVAAAREEVRRAQAALLERARRGEWLW